MNKISDRHHGRNGGEPPEVTQRAILEELRAHRLLLTTLCRLCDEFAGAFLNARFPHGRPRDRWGSK